MATLKKGDKTPNFKALDQHGKEHQLSDYAGKKLVIYFYPKDNTPGCTTQACNLRDNESVLQSNGISVLGVSPDSGSSHQKFTEKYQLNFPLLIDTEKEIIQAFGVWGPKKFMGKTYDGVNRTTFIIGEDGSILEVIEKVDTKNHTQQILDLLK
jgi:thioredoxin-dependent peroxiredoxin